jgi:hypothetical protein
MSEFKEDNSELWNGIRVFSSRWWDMDIPPEQLFETNATCKFYEYITSGDIKHTDAYKPYAMYLKHPARGNYVGIGVCEDGFVYMFDGDPVDGLPEVPTKDVVVFLMNYMNFIRAYNDFGHECIRRPVIKREVIYSFRDKQM